MPLHCRRTCHWLNGIKSFIIKITPVPHAYEDSKALRRAHSYRMGTIDISTSLGANRSELFVGSTIPSGARIDMTAGTKAHPLLKSYATVVRIRQ